MGFQQPWFKEWFDSPYYYNVYFNRNSEEAAAFIDRLIDYLKPEPGSHMLDIGCGRGRHSVYLAFKSFEVTGIDISENSIAEAMKNENEHLHFFTHDMRLPFYINYFDFAFNFFTSFGYFKTRREHDNSIRTISQSLKPEGIFVIDYLNVHFEEEHLVHSSELHINDVHYFITKWFDETHFYKKIIVKDNKKKNPIEFEEKVMKFTFGDFVDMLSFQGMQVQEVFGDYDLNKYDIRKSPRMIIVAKKLQPKL